MSMLVAAELAAVAGLVLVFWAGFIVGRGARRDRRRRLADLQTVLDRVSRDHAVADATMTSAGPFPVPPDYLPLSEVAAGWEKLEREQRGMGWMP